MKQEQLMTYVDAAFTFFERVAERVPSTLQVQQVLEVADIHESLEHIKLCGDIVLELREKGEEQEYQPIAGDWRVQEVGTSYLFWQWRDGAWEFSERIDDEIKAGDFIEHMNPVGKSGEYDYWRP